MKYLLDTHILLWANADDKKLSNNIKDIYINKLNDLYVSKASLWEMAIKVSLGKLTLGAPIKSYVKKHIIANKINILDISSEHIFQVETLPMHHRDPFDRLLISQALVEDMSVLTNDSRIKKYDVKVIS